MYAAGLACVWINISKNKKLQQWLLNGVLLAIPAIAALAIIYIGYLSKGTNPSNAGAGWLVKPETFSFPLAAPLLSGLSVDEMVNGLIYHPDVPLISRGLSLAIIFILAIGSLLLLKSIIRKIPHKSYALAFGMFYLAGTLFLSYLYLEQATVTFEGRHFRIIGILTIPGIVYLLHQTKAAKSILYVLFAGFTIWSAVYFVHGYIVNYQAPHGASGLAQQAYDKPTLDAIATLDAHHNDAIFVINSPDLGVEILHNRVITLDIGDMDAEDFTELTNAGKTGTIYMLMPENYVKNGVAAKIAKSFTGYHQFSIKQLSNDFYLYSASN